MSKSAKKAAIDRRNARPYLTCYLSTDSPLAVNVAIPKGATKTQIRMILRDTASLMGVAL